MTLAQDIAAKKPANDRPVLAGRKRQRNGEPKPHLLINNGQSGWVVLVTLLCVYTLAGLLGLALAALALAALTG